MPALLRELRADRRLQLYGAILSLIPALTPRVWRAHGVAENLGRWRPATCWPWFEACAAAHLTSRVQLDALLTILTVCGSAALALFLLGRVRAAWWFLTGATLLKAGLMTIDFSLRGNHHYFGFLITVAFLVVPERRRTVPWLIALTYAASGLIKLNDEWLSGAALAGRRFWLAGKGLELGAAYVVILELVLVWGLWLRRRDPVVFWFILAQLFTFHVFSAPAVGLWYPFVMVCLLSWFVLDRQGGPRWPRAMRARLYLAAVVASQAPAWLYGGPTDLSTEGRYLGVSLLMNRPECRGLMLLQEGTNRREIAMPTMRNPIRTSCDPIVMYNLARRTCAATPSLATTGRLDWYLLSKRSTADTYGLRLRAEDFCRDPRDFPWIQPNPWIDDSDDDKTHPPGGRR